MAKKLVLLYMLYLKIELILLLPPIEFTDLPKI